MKSEAHLSLANGQFTSILTDGEENDSKEINESTLKKLITECRDKKWAVIFMGTTEEATLNAVKDLGISSGNTYVFDNTAKGVLTVNKKMHTTRSKYTTSINNELNIDINNLIEQDI